MEFRQRLTAKIVEYEPPNLLTDQMESGAFRALRHEHRFKIEGEFTKMTDVVEFEAPWGLIGRLAERLFLSSYIRKLLVERGLELRALAEAKATPEPQQ